MSEGFFQHWRLQQGDDGILWLACDQAKATVNTLGQQVLAEFEAIVALCESNPTLKGVVLYSGKANAFIVGADIQEFSRLTDCQGAQAEADHDARLEKITGIIEATQKLFKRWRALPVPTVAMVHGACLGGGLELAMMCQYRVASISDVTRLALPEVKLGIHPGWGGTINLPALVGPVVALPAMLQGRMFHAKQAKRHGLIDWAVPERQLRAVACALLDGRLSGQKKCPWRVLSCAYPMRWLWARVLTHKLRQKVNSNHYPAVAHLLKQWVDHGMQESAWAAEARSVASLLISSTAKHLIGLFFASERMKRLSKQTLAVGLDGQMRSLERLHVVGAGTMGAEIAALAAQSGLTVTLNDTSLDALAKGMFHAKQVLQKTLRDRTQYQAAIDRLHPDHIGSGIENADCVIEAVVEDMAIKQAIFKSLEVRAKSNAVLASNTSSLSLHAMASVLQRPERLVGIHFFNPVMKMRLVEVIRGERTEKAVVQAAMTLVAKLQKLALPVFSAGNTPTHAPGFCINRVLMPYLLAAVAALESHDVEAIDGNAKTFGMPMGPLMLADTVGLDVCLKVAKALETHRGVAVPAILEAKVAAGDLGCKTGRGFLVHRPNFWSRFKRQRWVHDPALIDRMMFPLFQEALACVQDRVVDDAGMLDAGMVFGTGFAPFTGGPIHCLDAMSVDEIKGKLAALKSADQCMDDAIWARYFESR